jgi:hypothetical protein
LRLYQFTGFLAEIFVKHAAQQPQRSLEQSVEHQYATLVKLIKMATSRSFGLDHQFKSIGSVEQYQANLLIATHA